MDHCSTCRRTLNGALVCPGCGAYAPDIDPWLAAARAAESAQESRAQDTDASATAAAGAGADDKEHGGASDGVTPADDVDHAGPRIPVAGTEVAAAAGARSADEPGSGPAPDANSDPGSGADASHTADPDSDARPDPDPGGTIWTPGADSPAGPLPSAARWNKGRRRAAAVTALAFLGGGLTLAAVSSHSSKGPASSSATDPADTPNRTTAAPSDPTGGGPATSGRTAPARQAPSSRATGISPTAPLPPMSPPPRTSDGSIATGRGDPSSPTGGTGSTGTSTTPPTSSGSPTSPTTPPRHRVCVLALCFP
jgi:hypothetical protein